MQSIYEKFPENDLITFYNWLATQVRCRIIENFREYLGLKIDIFCTSLGSLLMEIREFFLSVKGKFA